MIAKDLFLSQMYYHLVIQFNITKKSLGVGNLPPGIEREALSIHRIFKLRKSLFLAIFVVK